MALLLLLSFAAHPSSFPGVLNWPPNKPHHHNTHPKQSCLIAYRLVDKLPSVVILILPKSHRESGYWPFKKRITSLLFNLIYMELLFIALYQPADAYIFSEMITNTIVSTIWIQDMKDILL